MKNLALALTIYVFMSGVLYAESNKHSVTPNEGFVPDANTAIKIAEAVWLPIYGERIYGKKPFVASLENDVWVVQGSMPKIMLGGVPVAEISKKTGEILRVSHGQ